MPEKILLRKKYIKTFAIEAFSAELAFSTKSGSSWYVYPKTFNEAGMDSGLFNKLNPNPLRI